MRVGSRVFNVLVAAFLVWLAFAVHAARALPVPPHPDDAPALTSPAPAPPTPLVRPVTLVAEYHGHTAKEWAARAAEKSRKLAHVHSLLKRRWRPTVDYAIRLASAVTGVPHSELRAVASCESGFFAYARNGKYKGIFQLGWSPFGFSPYDPVANALSAAMTVRHDGGWRQWECKP